jgi:hypothetical protein
VVKVAGTNSLLILEYHVLGPYLLFPLYKYTLSSRIDREEFL